MRSVKRLAFLTVVACLAFVAAPSLASAQAVIQSADTSSVLPQGGAFITGGTLGMTATGDTSVVRCVGQPVEVQFDGAATALSGRLMRSAVDPARTDVTAAWALASSAQSGVDPATFVAPITVNEYGIGWYKYTVTSLTGSPVNITISCRAR